MNIILFFFLQYGEVISYKRSPFLGGPMDCPLFFGANVDYHTLLDELYWTKLFQSKNSGLKIENTKGGSGWLAFTLFRVQPEPGFVYSRYASFLEALRRIRIYLHPKGVYFGVNLSKFTFYGKGELGDVKIDILPIGVSFGEYCGSLPIFPFFSIEGGGGIVTEEWKLTQDFPNAVEDSTTNSSCWWYSLHFGILYNVWTNCAVKLGLKFTQFILKHTSSEPIPHIEPRDDTQKIKEFKIGLGLTFSFPWRVRKTWE